LGCFLFESRNMANCQMQILCEHSLIRIGVFTQRSDFLAREQSARRRLCFVKATGFISSAYKRPSERSLSNRVTESTR
jgi:hypothetical protein